MGRDDTEPNATAPPDSATSDGTATHGSGGSTPAVVAARSGDETPDTAEIRALADAAGYAVVGEVTQRRREDPTYGLGRGAAEDLMRLVAETDAAAVLYDGSLSPGQTFSLGDLLPTGTAVIDRPRLVLSLFSAAADSGVADRQLELARLRYELPRIEEAAARDSNERVSLRPEGDPRVRDIERRIEAAERALDRITADRAKRRSERRSAGLDLVSLAGYTNAGKSTLASRLADDGDDGHGGNDTAEPSADGARPFETLSTTTRRATLDGRQAVVTDTVGFLDGLPHDAIRSFRATLDAVRRADCALLAVDASDDADAVRRKVHTSLSAIEATDGPVLPVFTKADRVEADALAAAMDTYRSVVVELDRQETPVAAALRSPVAVSARDGTGLAALRSAVADALPTATAAVTVSNGGETQAALSWAYDRGVVASVEYAGETVAIELGGRPGVVAEGRRRLARADGRSP
ncbi:GTPase [Halorubrum sp. PV6]|uniref:HflX-like GTP-binding protein n=1 Tax=Halorubrum sp. PV6 TaxID=634157 RepID=UPI000F852059|nr:GTPase [Halorubrum sp. PV6]AZQ14491.1 HflX family GTPase [Halorubrum sp. PV6]